MSVPVLFRPHAMLPLGTYRIHFVKPGEPSLDILHCGWLTVRDKRYFDALAYGSNGKPFGLGVAIDVTCAESCVAAAEALLYAAPKGPTPADDLRPGERYVVHWCGRHLAEFRSLGQCQRRLYADFRVVASASRPGWGGEYVGFPVHASQFFAVARGGEGRR